MRTIPHNNVIIKNKHFQNLQSSHSRVVCSEVTYRLLAVWDLGPGIKSHPLTSLNYCMCDSILRARALGRKHYSVDGGVCAKITPTTLLLSLLFL